MDVSVPEDTAFVDEMKGLGVWLGGCPSGCFTLYGRKRDGRFLAVYQYLKTRVTA